MRKSKWKQWVSGGIVVIVLLAIGYMIMICTQTLMGSEDYIQLFGGFIR